VKTGFPALGSGSCAGAALMTVRPYGRVVLVLECWEAPDLPYPWIM